MLARGKRFQLTVNQQWCIPLQGGLFQVTYVWKKKYDKKSKILFSVPCPLEAVGSKLVS